MKRRASEALAGSVVRKTSAFGGGTQEQRERSQTKSRLVDMLRTGNPKAEDEIEKRYETGELTLKDISAMQKEASLSLLASRMRFIHEPQDMLRIHRVGTGSRTAVAVANGD